MSWKNIAQEKKNWEHNYTRIFRVRIMQGIYCVGKVPVLIHPNY